MMTISQTGDVLIFFSKWQPPPPSSWISKISTFSSQKGQEDQTVSHTKFRNNRSNRCWHVV